MQQGKKGKKRWLIVVVMMAILGAIAALLKIRQHSQIHTIRAESYEPGTLDIAWEDDDYDMGENEIYTVFWSNKAGIKTHKVETYRHKKTVVGNRLRINAPYQFVHFVIAKSTGKTREFEATVQQDISLNRNNLDIRVMKRDHPMTLGVNVLEDAEMYKIYYQLKDGKTLIEDINVHGLSRTLLRLKPYEDVMITMSLVRAGKESERIFLAHHEKILPEAIK